MTPIPGYVILQNMLGVQLIVNYWEQKPHLLNSYLDDLARKGVKNVVSFVPMQVFESDISHSLTRFLQAAQQRRMTLSLIVTPEVGVHTAYSGLPRDSIGQRDLDALTHDGRPACVALPPQSVRLPSYFSNDFSKRYYRFLSKFNNMLLDLFKSDSKIFNSIEVIYTGSFWKYYRSLKESSLSPFGGICGDFSKASGVQFRWCVDEYYQDSEFHDGPTSVIQKFKSMEMDEVNRLWFAEQSETLFKVRTKSTLQKCTAPIRLKQVELFTPEADPYSFYGNLLKNLFSVETSFERLSHYIEVISRFESADEQSASLPFIHWLSTGVFQGLSDPQKQFLILKSLLYFQTLSGGLIIEEREWFLLSESFRKNILRLSGLLLVEELSHSRKLGYYQPHLWSKPSFLWDAVEELHPESCFQFSHFKNAVKNKNLALIIVDPNLILTDQKLNELFDYVQKGGALAIPRSGIFTEAAKRKLTAIIESNKGFIDMQEGLDFQLYPYGKGQLVVYDLPESDVGLQKFLKGLTSLVELEVPCELSDQRVEVLSFSMNQFRGGGGKALFLLNSSQVSISVDIYFKKDVSVVDLVHALQSKGPMDATEFKKGRHFQLNVPAYGILPLLVEPSNQSTTQDDIVNLLDEGVHESWI